MLVVGKRSDVRLCKEKEVLLKIKPTNALFAEILNSTKVETIYCTAGMARHIPFKTMVALRKVGVKVKTIKGVRGRPAVHGKKEIERMRRLHAKGMRMKEIARSMGIPLRSAYHLLRKANKSRRAKE